MIRNGKVAWESILLSRLRDHRRRSIRPKIPDTTKCAKRSHKVQADCLPSTTPLAHFRPGFRPPSFPTVHMSSYPLFLSALRQNKVSGRDKLAGHGVSFLIFFFWFSERTLVGNCPITHVPDKQPVSLVKKSTNRSMYNQPNTQYICFVFN